MAGGAALRLAFTLSGGATGVLDRTALRLADDGAAVLDLHADGAALDGDIVAGRLQALADALGRTARVEFRQSLVPAGSRLAGSRANHSILR